MKGYDDIVCSSRVRFARNIKGLKFPPALSGEEEIYSVLYKGVLQACNNIFPNNYYDIATMDKIEAEAMKERHLVSDNLINKLNYGALILSKTEDISIMLNEEDHIREQAILSGYKLDECFNVINRVDDEIAKYVPIAFDKRYGYLTSCLTNLGNAMRASAMVFLPALTYAKRTNRLFRALEDLGLTARGVYGEGSQADGCMYQISNQKLQMKSEKEVLTILKKALEQIFDIERKERENLYKNSKNEITDMTMRSYGLITNAYMMESKEFTENLTNVKLGVCLGIINADMETLNKLTVYTQRAMLCKLAGRRINEVDEAKTRMAIVKRMLN